MRAEPPDSEGAPKGAARGAPIAQTGTSGAAATRFGPYWLDSRLAVGGTAEVYLARPLDPRAEPARLVVKRLLPHFVSDREGRTMFEREAKLHAAVTHENVVVVFGSGVAEGGEPYLAMEYVDGLDGYRLLRRLRHEGRSFEPDLAVHVAREVLRALSSVHAAKGEGGRPLGIIHRDVTPSNVYFAVDGRVKLGDFGIARESATGTLRTNASAVLKGKFAYLAPEQVAGEPFDHRADLFSLASVLAEMLLGKPLFPGGGQLAVLLAIRDGRIDPLFEMKGLLPPGLFEVLERALARDPQKRFPTADAFAAALAPFGTERSEGTRELGALVRRLKLSPSTDAMAAVRESARELRAAAPATAGGSQLLETGVRVNRSAHAHEAGFDDTLDDAFDDVHVDAATGQYNPLPSYVELSDGTRLGPWTFARLIEACATGQIGRGDRVDFMGRGFQPISELDDLVRHLPMRTATTNQLQGPGAPDFFDDLSTAPMLGILLKVLVARDTGVLFAEGPVPAGGPASVRGQEQGRKELYFEDGKLHHVASSNAHELLGEYLVRRGKLAREELDLALAVLPRYGGRLGDTLISLGLVGPVDIFRAIREQGRDRVADLFSWREGTVTFYRGQRAPHVEFPLDLDLPGLMVAGLEKADAVSSVGSPRAALQGRFDSEIGLAREPPAALQAVAWPPLVARVLAVASTKKALRDVIRMAARGGAASSADIVCACHILIAAHLLEWK